MQWLGTVDPAKAASLYNQIDSILWKDMATLPLFQNPDVYAWSNNYANIVPNPSQLGISWNADVWGLKA